MVRRLGKGLDALFPDVDETNDSIHELPIKDCRPNPYQPRKTFRADAIEELKESIIEYGIIQPLIVRKSIKGYEIVAGERRFRAGKEAGLVTVPAVIKEMTDHQMMEIALLENLQREDLTPIEEAQAYSNLITELKITQEELSKKLGKSRSHITNMMRLLVLPKEIIADINSGKLTMGHGRALLGLQEKENILPVAKKASKEKMNVRQIENLVNQLNTIKPKKKTKPKKDIFIMERESLLRDRFGTSVNIMRGKKKGKIEIEFYSDDDLERIIEVLEG